MAKDSKYKKLCSGMSINPYFAGSMLDEYGVVKAITAEFQIAARISDEYVRYCALVLDPLSPMVREFPDAKIRRSQAAKETGFTGDIVGTFEMGLLMRVYRNREWTLINCLENTFDEYTQTVNEPIDIEDKNEQLKTVEIKNKLLDQMGSFIDKIQKYKSQMFGGDDVLIQADAAIRPEDVAKFTKNK